MSGLGSGVDQEIGQYQPDSGVLPGYVAYLVMLFQLLITTVDLLLASWVVYTIKTTRSLHKPHNIFVANLLITGMIITPLLCLISVPMIVSFQLGIDSFITCPLLKIALLLFQVNSMTFVVIAADKAIAITFPYKYKRIMTSRVVTAIIIGMWLIALIPTAITIFTNADGLIGVPEFGACIFRGTAYTEYLLTSIMPITMKSIFAIILNIYLAIVAYKVHKQIEKETRLSGSSRNQSGKMTALKKKQHDSRRNIKPVITLLVVTLSNIFIVLVFLALYILGKKSSEFYQELVEYIIIPNSVYLIELFNPLAYGLYFKQVREPMMKRLKRFIRSNKVNAVAPQP